LKISLLTMKY